MRYADYLKAVIESYPDRRFDVIMTATTWNKVDLVKAVADIMFIDGDVNSILAIETRKQLKSLNDKGIHCFDA
jgi:hypothetical protein